MSEITPRIKRIQKAIGVDPDGIIGAATLTAAEKALGLSMVSESTSKTSTKPPKNKAGALHSMTPSVKAVKMIIEFEVSGESYYNRALAKPSWPGGASGVTIGIGYDVGYNSASQVEKDWGGLIADAFVQDLKGVAGLKGSEARDAARRLAGYQRVLPVI